LADPADTPVTTPVEASTVATDVLSEDHDPPDVPSVEAVEVEAMLILADDRLTVPALQAIVKLIVFEKVCPLHSGVV
jgi:hypothetical protein